MRRELTKQEVNVRSKKVQDLLLGMRTIVDAQSIGIYVSYEGEVDTHSLIELFLRQKKNVFVPLVQREKKRMSFSQIKSLQDLSPGEYGILEPILELRNGREPNLDVIVVPGVAFDNKGSRLGQGGGYYDQFLKKTDATSIGLAYDFQILAEIPLEEHDRPVDFVVSESRIYG